MDREASAALKWLLEQPVTFDPMRDPNWRPTREDYAHLADIVREMADVLNDCPMPSNQDSDVWWNYWERTHSLMKRLREGDGNATD